MTFTDYLEKIAAALDTVITNKTRVVGTVQYADTVLKACLDASTGDTEKKVFGDLKAITDKLLTILS